MFFGSAKNRVPSYCDRVLWRVQEDSYEGVDLSVEQLSYGCVMAEKSSDHKPVFAEFIIQVSKKDDRFKSVTDTSSIRDASLADGNLFCWFK